MVLKEFVNQCTMHGFNNMKVKNYLSLKKRKRKKEKKKNCTQPLLKKN